MSDFQYAVYCHGHFEGHGCGIVELSKKVYETQLSCSDKTWRCPSCGAEASWDDGCLETRGGDEPGEG